MLLVGKLIQMCQERRGEQKSISFLSADRVVMVYKMPLNEIVEDFFDQLKGATSGYASFDYEEAGYAQADVVKLTIGLNGDPVDALSSECAVCLSGVCGVPVRCVQGWTRKCTCIHVLGVVNAHLSVSVCACVPMLESMSS